MFIIITNTGDYWELPYAKTFRDAKREMFLKFSEEEAKNIGATLAWDESDDDNIFLVETINGDGQGDVFYELEDSWESAVSNATFDMERNPHFVCKACRMSDFDDYTQAVITEQLLYS